MSAEEKRFLRQLKIATFVIIFPLVLSCVGIVVYDHFENCQFRKVAKENAESIKIIRVHFMKTQDYFDFVDNEKELIKANRDNDLERIRRLEKEQDEIKRYIRDTRGSKVLSNLK